MLSVALTKPICGCLALFGGLGTTGGICYLARANKVKSTVKHDTEHIEKVYFEEVASPTAPKNNLAILVEVNGSSNTSVQAPANQQKVKCQLEGGTSNDYCSLSKMTSLPASKWVDKSRFDGYAFNFFIPDDFITKEKVTYKVRVHNDLITEWLASPQKLLHVYGQRETSEPTTPLITLAPTFAITKQGKFKGQMQYVLGKTKVLTGTTSSNENLEIAGKYFQCALPVASGANPEYKNCEFYVFDAEEKVEKNFYQDVLKTPLTKLTTVKKNVHYLLKFEEIMDVRDVKYGSTQQLTVKVFADEARKTPVTTGVTQVSLQELSPFVFVGDDVDIQVAVVI